MTYAEIYASTKHADKGLAKTLRNELKGTGVRL